MRNKYDGKIIPEVPKIDDTLAHSEAEALFHHKTELGRRKLNQIDTNENERKSWAQKIFILMVTWLTASACLVILSGFGKWTGFRLAETTLNVLLATTTINIISLMAIILKGIFKPLDF